MVDHAVRLGRALTCARLGLFLENLGLDGLHEHLFRLGDCAPKQSTYFDRVNTNSDTTNQFVRRWNLVADLDFLLYLDGRKPEYVPVGTILDN